MVIFRKISAKLKKNWMRFALRNVSNSDNFKELNRFYLVNNPWKLDSPSEQYRFSETNRLILNAFGRVKSLLEIGSGEGHHSIYLQQICDHLTGLEVSERAVKRAQKKCPNSEFLVGDIFSEKLNNKIPFDLVVACEVLYYMSDLHKALMRMRELGCNNFVTYYSGAIQKMDPQVLSLPGTVSKILEFGQSRWRIVWWSS